MQEFFYGLVQGITEYLPVSSSAHLLLLPRLFGLKDLGASFDIFIHLGTLFATLIYFRSIWMGLVESQKSYDFRQPFSWFGLGVGTLPAAVLGLAFHSAIENHLRGNTMIGTGLIFGGLMLYLSDRLAPCERKGVETVTYRDWVVMGCFQALALIPGFSRSGSSMSGGRILGFSRPEAARLSFLLSAPITALAIAYETMKLIRHPEGIPNAYWIGTAFAALFGILTIRFLLQFLNRFGFGGFFIYRVGLGAFLLFS